MIRHFRAALGRQASLGLLCAGLAFVATTARAQSPAPPAFEYRVQFPAVEQRWMQVEARFPGLPAGPADIRMSRVSPGRYALHEFAKNVFDVQVTDGQGRPLAPRRPSLHQWDVAGHDGTVSRCTLNTRLGCPRTAKNDTAPAPPVAAIGPR